MNTFLLFVICTFANVILSTIKSLMTIKGGKVKAAIWNALSFGLYSYIVIMTANAPITTLEKILITIGCNLIGVYSIKLLEEKMRKDRLWKIEMTVNISNADNLHKALTDAKISNSYILAGKHAVFSCYCDTKKETDTTLAIGAQFGAKTFATETKLVP